jgi:hypothetical protein
MVATGLASASTFAIVISAVRLQNAFGSSAAAVEAWDVTHTLSAKLLSVFSYLVSHSPIVCIRAQLTAISYISSVRICCPKWSYGRSLPEYHRLCKSCEF